MPNSPRAVLSRFARSVAGVRDRRSRGRGSDGSRDDELIVAPPSAPFRSLPALLLVVVLVVDVVAVAVLVVPLVRHGATGGDLGAAGLLALVGIGYGEAARRLRPARAVGPGALHTDLTSVWVFAGALVLPTGLAAVLVVVVQTAAWLRDGQARVPLHRHVYSTAAVVLAASAAGTVAALLGGAAPARDLLAVAAAAVVFAVVNNLLVALVVWLSEPVAGVAERFGRVGENVVEVATIALGGLVAAALGINTWLVLFALPAVLVLERAVALPQLEEEARLDGKTGLLTIAAWHRAALRELRRASPRGVARAVLVIDLDHFKRVNDSHGHLVGDAVLSAVAEKVLASVRRRDLVGRFGGEEFVVLVTPSHGGSADLVAERIRARIAERPVCVSGAAGVVRHDVSVSIGVAVQRSAEDPGGRGELADLLPLADAALYAAKRAGRDCVRVAEWGR